MALVNSLNESIATLCVGGFMIGFGKRLLRQAAEDYMQSNYADRSPKISIIKVLWYLYLGPRATEIKAIFAMWMAGWFFVLIGVIGMMRYISR